MGFAILILYTISILVSLSLSFNSYKNKKFVLSIILFGTFLRLCFALIIESGAKYDLAWDSLKYEADAWSIAKSWISQVPIEVERAHAYSYWLASLFYIFGKNSLLGVWFNILAFLFSSILLVKSFSSYLPNSKQPALITSVLITFYPSWFIWSTVLVKDPFLIFAGSLFLFSVTLFLRRHNFVLALFLMVLAVYLLYLFRLPSLVFITASFIITGLWLPFTKKIGPRYIVLFSLLIGILSGLAWSFLWPENFYLNMQSLLRQRLTYANYGTDSYAESSFLIKPDLNSGLDLIIFQFKAILFYFWSPFLWMVKNLRQGFSLIESVPLFFLTLIAIKGFLRSEKKHPKVSLFILAMCLVPSIIQANIVSNMGTIYRFRTFYIILLFFFVEWGLTKISTASTKKFGEK